MIGDLAGFVASLHYRGIPVVQCPTTVVAQVDSAIGGKTGVNSPLGKNLIGTFHQPRLVLSDTSTLSTLPDRIFREGLAEVIKHAVIADAEMLDHLPPDRSSPLASLIARNASIKARIVAEDEFETKGTRALLNFGHTLGHAVEAQSVHHQRRVVGRNCYPVLAAERQHPPEHQAQVSALAVSLAGLREEGHHVGREGRARCWAVARIPLAAGPGPGPGPGP